MERFPHSPASEDKDTARLEAFSDGVFSIAMTLLVLELKVPAFPATPTTAALWSELGRQWPSYFSFVTSFFTVLIMWVNHHGIFTCIRRSDKNLLFVNGVLLLLVTAVPFPTALVAAYLRTPAGPAACAVYAGVFVLISLAYAMVLIAAKRGGHLLMPGAEPEITKRLRDCLLIGFPAYSLAAIVAPFSRWISIGICSALWVFWACANVERASGFDE